MSTRGKVHLPRPSFLPLLSRHLLDRYSHRRDLQTPLPTITSRFDAPSKGVQGLGRCPVIALKCSSFGSTASLSSTYHLDLELYRQTCLRSNLSLSLSSFFISILHRNYTYITFNRCPLHSPFPLPTTPIAFPPLPAFHARFISQHINHDQPQRSCQRALQW